MPITDDDRRVVKRTQYQIRCVSDLDGVWFTETFDEQVDHALAATLCKNQGVVLQSAYEALAMRLVSAGANYSAGAQTTRTTALIVGGGKRLTLMAFDDIDDPQLNLGLLYADQIQTAMRNHSRFELSAHDERVALAVRRAQRLPHVAQECVHDLSEMTGVRACLGNLVHEAFKGKGARAYWGDGRNLADGKVIVLPVVLCPSGHEYALTTEYLQGYVRGRFMKATGASPLDDMQRVGRTCAK